MRPVADAVVEAGLINEDTLDELAKWGIHITAMPQTVLRTVDDVVEHIRQAYESLDQVRIDETDLDVLHVYLSKANQKKGRLVVKEGKKHTTVNVTFCLTKIGEYVIPWTDEESPDILANGETHLKWHDGGTLRDVKFASVRELFFGSKKAFAVCAPAEENDDEGSS